MRTSIASDEILVGTSGSWRMRLILQKTIHPPPPPPPPLHIEAFVAAYPMSTFVATANTHISDLTLIPHVTHTVCVP